MRRPRLPRPSMVMLPNGFTLANLFFGIYAIVTASRGDYARAVTYILIGALCDAMDGRIARATGTGSRFGEELDSLVDAVSFGLAPAMIMYFAVLHREGWDWGFVFLFAACAVMRLARFNVEQAGRAKSHFNGLPSPAAGGVLATYYWFSQTPLYNETMIGELPWHTMLRFMMGGLGFLMISNVPYPAWPKFNLRTWRGVIGLLVFIGLGVGLFFLPKEFFFPVGMTYVLYGVVSAVLKGLLDRQVPADGIERADDAVAVEYIDDDDDDDEIKPIREADVSRRRHRRRRGRRNGPPNTERDPIKDSTE
jgi:CDP-diacylglycerol--serine O-phosphatidyltransferase